MTVYWRFLSILLVECVLTERRTIFYYVVGIEMQLSVPNMEILDWNNHRFGYSILFH